MNGFNFSDASDIRLGGSTITALYYGSTLLWPTGPDYSKEYLTIEETVDSSTVFFTTTDTITTKSIQYSKDQINWTSVNFNTNEYAPSVNITKGEKLYLKAINDTYYSTNGGFFSISIQGYSVNSKTKIYGNIMSLIYGDNFYGQTTLNSNNYGAFDSLFYPWNIVGSSLYDASDLILPATTLSDICYQNMFGNCTSLTTAPELPATTLSVRCYQQMFSGCYSLTTAPELPATTLDTGCYNEMFYDCRNLIDAPELPATTLANNCYQGMFQGCTSLNYIKCLATNVTSTYYTSNWVNNVASSGTFVKNENTTGWTTGNSGIPTGWTVIDA